MTLKGSFPRLSPALVLNLDLPLYSKQRLLYIFIIYVRVPKIKINNRLIYTILMSVSCKSSRGDLFHLIIQKVVSQIREGQALWRGRGEGDLGLSSLNWPDYRKPNLPVWERTVSYLVWSSTIWKLFVWSLALLCESH